MKDLVDVDLWRKVFLGSYLVELYFNNELSKYKLGVEIAEIGQIHSPKIITVLK